jgi:hypothetical protein
VQGFCFCLWLLVVAEEVDAAQEGQMGRLPAADGLLVPGADLEDDAAEADADAVPPEADALCGVCGVGCLAWVLSLLPDSHAAALARVALFDAELEADLAPDCEAADEAVEPDSPPFSAG